MYTFVFSVEWGLHGNQDTFCFQPAVSSLSSHCIRARNTFVKLIVWMSAAFRTILAWIWEAMRCSEEKAELGAKKSRLTFCLCHQSPRPFLLPLRGHPAPNVPYNPDILWLFERKGREEWKRMWAVLIFSMVYTWLSHWLGDIWNI